MAGTGCGLGSGYAVFLEKFGMGLSWVMWEDFWLESIDGPRLGDMEGCLVGIFTGLRLGDPERILVGNLEQPPAGGIRNVFGWKA